jgi:Holliday junction resolvase
VELILNVGMKCLKVGMMTRSKQAAAKARGSQFETGVLKWLRGKGVTAERLRLAGKADEGDIVCFVSGKPYVLELKATAKLDLPGFWREAVVEAENYAKARGITPTPPAYVIVKRRNASIDQAWVVQTLEQWIGQQ